MRYLKHFIRSLFTLLGLFVGIPALVLLIVAGLVWSTQGDIIRIFGIILVTSVTIITATAAKWSYDAEDEAREEKELTDKLSSTGQHK